jgi:hypothetical protein
MRDPAAVHQQRRSGDRGGGLACEKGRECTDFFDGRKPLVRLLSKQYVPDYLIVGNATCLRLLASCVISRQDCNST